MTPSKSFEPGGQGLWNETADPEAVIGFALGLWPGAVITSGFNLNGIVLIDLAVRAGYRGKVIFVDTGYHFPETLETRERLAERYPKLEFITLNAALPDDRLFERDADACCLARKVGPLKAYLAEAQPKVLFSARSRDQAVSRAELGFIELGEPVKVNPLAYWTRERLEAYAREHDLSVNPLYWEGFLSIGCAPCTRAVRPGEDARAGRWTGLGKTECGLWHGREAL